MDFAAKILAWTTRKVPKRQDQEPALAGMYAAAGMAMPSSMYTVGSSIAPELPKQPTKSEILAAKIAELARIEPAKIAFVPRVPDYTQTLTGWRAWKVHNEKLYSLGMSQYWEPRVAKEAFCAYEGGYETESATHPSPARDCSCGYWSFSSMDILMDALKAYSGVAVVGSIEIWGRVIECENGYRSQFAYPKELWLLKPDLEYLSWTYGVPVRTL